MIRPTLAELHEYVTGDYAAEWKTVGVLLNICIGELNAIEASSPSDPKRCCNRMFEIWLDNDPSANWDKLFVAIESPAVFNKSCSQMLKKQLGIDTDATCSKSFAATETLTLSSIPEDGKLYVM